MTLPIDRTKYNAAASNQQPSITASSQANREALKVLFDTSDELYNYVLNLVTSGTLSPLPPDFMYRQGIINAGMGVAQRVGDLGSKTLATGTSAYVVDRIKTFNNGSGVNATVSQVAVSDLDGAGHGLQIVHAAAPSTGGKLAHSYTLEARDAYKWAGLPCVKALKVKGVSGMDRVTINARYKTSESAVDSSSTLISSTTLAINNLSWQVIPLTVATLPIRATLTNTGVIGFEIVFSKTTSEASGDGGIITELELIKGGIDLGYQPKRFDEELLACQRYYEKSYGYADLPGTASYPLQPLFTAISALAGSTAGTVSGACMFPFKVRKRAIPTVTLYDFDGTANAVRVYNTDAKKSGVTAINSLKDTGTFQSLAFDNSSATAVAAGNVIAANWVSEVEL